MALWIDSNNAVHDDMDGAALELPNWPKGMTQYTPPAPTAAQLLAEAQASQIAVLSSACQAQIYAGFTSSALGAAYTYPAKDKDQSNLAASVLDSLLPNLPVGWTTPFICADANGVWAYRNHTVAQIQQAGADGKAAILNALVKNNTLAGQVREASDTASVQAIVW